MLRILESGYLHSTPLDRVKSICLSQLSRTDSTQICGFSSRSRETFILVMPELKLFLLYRGIVYLRLLVELSFISAHRKPSSKGRLVHRKGESFIKCLVESLILPLSHHQKQVLYLFHSNLAITIKLLEQVSHIFIVESNCPSKCLRVE